MTAWYIRYSGFADVEERSGNCCRSFSKLGTYGHRVNTEWLRCVLDYANHCINWMVPFRSFTKPIVFIHGKEAFAKAIRELSHREEKKKLDETGIDPVTYPLRRDHSTI